MSKTIRTTAVSAVTALAVLAGGAGSSVAAPAKADAAGPKAAAASSSSCKSFGLRSKFFVQQSNKVRMQVWLVDGQWRTWFRSTSGPTRGTGYYGYATITQPTRTSIKLVTEWDDDTVRPGIYKGRVDADGYVKGTQTDPIDSRNGSTFYFTTALKCLGR